ncbi:MAG: hypothetical protein BWY87_00880 [Deltaproteobacteria bacterium ADurb.Bin510]|nr:MAG: hypothetical protein BWY87_00880 [Deltaproteobacteria bacterium ADurb.Bin510]
MKKRLSGFIGSLVILGAVILPLAAVAMNVGGTELVKVGTGTRTKLGLSLYTNTLYVPAALKAADGTAIVTADQSMSAVLKVTSVLVDSEKFNKAVRDGFKQSASAGFRTDKSEFYLGLFKGIEVKKGCVFQHDYDASKKSMTVTYTSPEGAKRVLGTVPSAQFKSALFAMWIGPKPLSEGLKSGMLGK